MEFEVIKEKGNLKAWRHDEGLVFQHDAPLDQSGWPTGGQAKHFILDVLGRERQCMNFFGVARCKTGRGWFRLTRANADVTLIEARVVFVRTRVNLNELNWSNDAKECDTLAESLSCIHDVQVCECPRPLTDVLAESCQLFPTAHGALNHPIWPSVPEGWLENVSALRPLAETDFPHLKALFSAWPLSGWSHATLYCFLLGQFHSNSLTHARPILWVDSAVRQRGKSMASQAITALIDGQESALTLSGDRKAAEETLVSHLVRGGRCANVANLDGRHHFKNDLLSNLSTDGADVRAKYGRETSRLYGNVLMTSSVLGRVTVHEDLLSRIWRVELPGEAEKLSVEPLDYAKTHREEIQREIITALARAAKYSEKTVTRFGDFESVAAAAYAVTFGLEHAEVKRSLETMARRRLVLQHSVMMDLVSSRPELFDEPLIRQSFDRVAKLDAAHYDGAGAFELVLQGGEWREEEPASGAAAA